MIHDFDAFLLPRFWNCNFLVTRFNHDLAIGNRAAFSGVCNALLGLGDRTFSRRKCLIGVPIQTDGKNAVMSSFVNHEKQSWGLS